MSNEVIHASRTAAKSFWVWWDPLLEEVFCIPSPDREAEKMLAHLAKEGVKPVHIEALGRSDAVVAWRQTYGASSTRNSMRH